MKVIEAIKGPLVIVLSSYDPKERSGTREYYGLGFIEVGRPQRFSKEKDVERADRFHEEVTAIIGEHPHYKAVEGYPFGVRFEKLYSPSEIADFRNSWAADTRGIIYQDGQAKAVSCFILPFVSLASIPMSSVSFSKVKPVYFPSP